MHPVRLGVLWRPRPEPRFLAAQHPHRVRRLVVFGGNSYLTEEDIAAYEATRNVAESWSKRMREPLEAVYGEEELQKMWSSACDGWASIMHDGGGDICQSEARAIQCPTLVMGGDKDPIVPTFHPHWFADNIPGARLYMFPEGKHNIHQEMSAKEFKDWCMERVEMYKAKNPELFADSG